MGLFWGVGLNRNLSIPTRHPFYVAFPCGKAERAIKSPYKSHEFYMPYDLPSHFAVRT